MIHSSLIPYQNQPPYTLWCNWCTVYNTRVCYTIICLRKCVWECPWAPLDPTLPYFTTKFWCLNCPSVYPKVADFSTQFYTITRSGCGREHNSATPGQKQYNPCNKYSLPLPSSPQLSHIHPLFLLTFCPAFPRTVFHIYLHILDQSLFCLSVLATLEEQAFTLVAKYVISQFPSCSFLLLADFALNCRTGAFDLSFLPLVSAGQQSSGRHGDLSFCVGLPEKKTFSVADHNFFLCRNLPPWHACRQMC